jgi:hypothetical protein
VWTPVLPNTHAAENYSRLVSIDLLLVCFRSNRNADFVIIFYIAMLTKTTPRCFQTDPFYTQTQVEFLIGISLLSSLLVFVPLFLFILYLNLSSHAVLLPLLLICSSLSSLSVSVLSSSILFLFSSLSV